jgi:hypothetical protein
LAIHQSVVAWMKKKQSQEHQQLVMPFCVCHLPNVLQNDTKCVLIEAQKCQLCKSLSYFGAC